MGDASSETRQPQRGDGRGTRGNVPGEWMHRKSKNKKQTQVDGGIYTGLLLSKKGEREWDG